MHSQQNIKIQNYVLSVNTWSHFNHLHI